VTPEDWAELRATDDEIRAALKASMLEFIDHHGDDDGPPPTAWGLAAFLRELDLKDHRSDLRIAAMVLYSLVLRYSLRVGDDGAVEWLPPPGLPQ